MPKSDATKPVGRGGHRLRLNLLIDGIFLADRRLFLPEQQQETYGGVAKSLLIQTGKEKILVDTGIGKPPEGPWTEAVRRFERESGIRPHGIMKELAKVGVRPEEITSVVNTHLHNAHAGGNNLFKNAQFFIAKNEFSFIDKLMGRYPQQSDYNLGNFEGLRSLNETSGEYKITEEVRVIPTPGHTTGHQSVVISLEDGKKLVYSGDVAPLKENLVQRIAMSGYDRGLSLQSMKKLLEIGDAKWIFSHDNAQLSLAKAYTP